MTDTQPTSETVRLNELKRAIEAVPDHPGPCIPGQNVERWLASLHEHRRWAVEAWRTAFEWHVGLIKRHADLSEQVGAHLTDWIAIDREEEEGIALIREKLK